MRGLGFDLDPAIGMHGALPRPVGAGDAGWAMARPVSRCCPSFVVGSTLWVVLVAAIVIFVVQNSALMTMSLLAFSVRAPLAILAVVAYVLGAITGGSLYACCANR